IARSTPAVMGGPKKERLPVLGSSVPSLSGPSAAGAEPVAVGEALGSLPPPPAHAVAVRASAAPTARKRPPRVKRDRGGAIMLIPLKSMPSRLWPDGRPRHLGYLGT